MAAELQSSVDEAERLRQELADLRHRFGGDSSGSTWPGFFIELEPTS